MKIIEVELKLFRRLALRNINFFKLLLVDDMQLFLGTNGCGKSSIVGELNFVPPNLKDDFLKGGYKKVVGIHEGETYTALSIRDDKGGQKHSLIRHSDGAELNEGGTVTVQREIVYRLFGETREIRDLVDGRELFTRMGPPRRREWLTKICVVDFTYAIKLYKKAQEKLSGTKGYVSNLKTRLVTESTKLMSEEQVRELREEHAKLTAETQQLYLLRNAAAAPLSSVKERAAFLQSTLTTLTAQFRSARGILKDKYWHHPDAISEGVTSAIAAVAREQALYDRASARYEELTKDADPSETLVTKEELGAMMAQALEIDAKIEKIKGYRKLALAWEDPMAANNSLTSIFDDVREIFLVIADNPDRKFSPTNHTAIVELHDKLLTSIKVTEEKLGILGHQLKHLDALANKESIECPECDHEWKIGYDAQLHENLKRNRDEMVEYVNMRKAEFEIAQQNLTDSTTYMEQMKQILQTMRYTPYLQPLWDTMLADDMIRRYPKQCATQMEMARNDLMHDLQIGVLSQDFKDLQGKIERAKESQTDAHAARMREIEREQRNVGYAAGMVRWHQDMLNSAQLFQKEYNNAMQIQDRIRRCMDDIDSCTQAAIDSIKNDVIDCATSEAMGQIAILAQRLNQIELHQATVKDIEEQILVGEKARRSYELLVKSLNPVDGIIAEGMLGFIRDFVARMNSFIARIWTYPMEVKDCSLEDDSAELNYRFPLIVDNVMPPVHDVGSGSDGQMEVVDLAFRIAAGQCLKLDTGPLVLDEFGRTFDEAHREAATQVIRQIVEELHYSQFFVISHYNATHGAFYKAQMTVIDKRNITVPSGREYNTHTTIET